MNSNEKNIQAQNLINELDKITSAMGNNSFAVESAANAKYELSVFRQNLEKYAKQFGRDDSFVKQLEPLAEKIEERLKSDSPLAYI